MDGALGIPVGEAIGKPQRYFFSVFGNEETMRSNNMQLRNFIFILAFLAVTTPSLAQNDVQANATRPSAADNAYLTTYGYTELEFGWSAVRKAWSLPAFLKFTPHRKLELGFTMTGLLNHTDIANGGETDFGDPGLQVKPQLVERNWGALAAVARIEFPSGVDPKYTGYGVISIQAKSFALDAILGGVFADQGNGKYDEAFLYAIAFAPKLNGQIGVFAEVFGERSSSSNPLSVDFGISYAILPGFVFDLSGGVGLNDDAPDWLFQVGFTSVLFRVFD